MCARGLNWWKTALSGLSGEKGGRGCRQGAGRGAQAAIGPSQPSREFIEKANHPATFVDKDLAGVVELAH